MFDRPPLKVLALIPSRTGEAASVDQTIELETLTVFVGPNNSGKSRVLREIGSFCFPDHNYDYGARNKIVRNISAPALSIEEAVYLQGLFQREPEIGQNIPPGNILYKHKHGQDSLTAGVLLQILTQPEHQPFKFRQLYLANTTVNLSGENRIALTGPKPIGDLQRPEPFNSLQVLFADDGLRDRVRAILYRAFGKYFVIDPTRNGQLSIAYSAVSPRGSEEEQGLHAQARKFFAATEPIELASDGVKAFTGITLEVLAGNPRVVLIDEPEAFLHPPLAQQLGAELTALAVETKKNVFVSTHSSHFLMGCLNSGAPVDVVRLTYRDGVATARILRNEELLRLMRNPLLRSTGVINALFFENVVVTESDSDRAFYEEVNERMLRYSPGRGIPNCLFLNAQNWQTTRMLTKPLREIGIPTVSIVDVDVLKQGGQSWADFLASGFLPEIEKQSLAVSRKHLYDALEITGKNYKREGGISLLDTEQMEAANNLFDRLEEYGLFVVRHGELEAWLKWLGAQGHSPAWLTDIFTRMGDDPASPAYVRPSNDDVWEFMDRVRSWLLDKKRKGIPN